MFSNEFCFVLFVSCYGYDEFLIDFRNIVVHKAYEGEKNIELRPNREKIFFW